MKWIRDRREQLRMTIDELVAKLELEGVSYTAGSVGHWESGRRNPPMHDRKFVRALASALKLDVPTVLRLSGFEINAQHSEIAERLANIADKLPEEDKLHLLMIAETFLSK
jgi:transcriptional regulator with XRE-family HTH domain